MGAPPAAHPHRAPEHPPPRNCALTPNPTLHWACSDACPLSAAKPNKTTDVTDLWATSAPAKGRNNSWLCSQTHQAAGCVYEDEIFVEEVLANIAAHDVSKPFFLFWAPHIAHEPLEVPQAFLDKFAFIDTRPRQFYMAMINYVDTLVGRVVDALKAKGSEWLCAAPTATKRRPHEVTSNPQRKRPLPPSQCGTTSSGCLAPITAAPSTQTGQRVPTTFPSVAAR